MKWRPPNYIHLNFIQKVQCLPHKQHDLAFTKQNKKKFREIIGVCYDNKIEIQK
jgi:hypothetical protein